MYRNNFCLQKYIIVQSLFKNTYLFNFKIIIIYFLRLYSHKVLYFIEIILFNVIKIIYTKKKIQTCIF